MRIFWKPLVVFCLLLLNMQNGYCSEEFLKEQAIVTAKIENGRISDNELSDIHVDIDEDIFNDSKDKNYHKCGLETFKENIYTDGYRKNSKTNLDSDDVEMEDYSNFNKVRKRAYLEMENYTKNRNRANDYGGPSSKSYDNYGDDRRRSYGMSAKKSKSLKVNNQLSSPLINRQVTTDYEKLFRDGVFEGKENGSSYHTNYHKELEIFKDVDQKLENMRITMDKFEPFDIANILEEYTALISPKKKTAAQLREKYPEYNLDEGILNKLCEIGNVQESNFHCVTYYKDLAKQQELEELYDILCSHMQNDFGEDAWKTEGAERILSVVQIYQAEFKEFILQEKWNLQEMLQNPDYEKVKQENRHADNYQLKKKVLASLLTYYTKITGQMSVDAIVQASVGVIKCNQTGDLQCYLPHRDEELFSEKCKNRYKKRPNWKAVGLACLAFWLQIVVPVAIIYKNIALNQDTLMPLASGEMIKSICPSLIFHIFGEDKSAAQVSYNFVTRITGTGLMFLLNKQLVTDLAEEYEQFIVNCSNHALPQTGLIVSRVMNSIVYMLINGTTMILFIQNPTLADMLLNFLAMEMLMKIDDILGEYVTVKNGIGSSNDQGRKLLLTFLTKGERKDTWAESILSCQFVKFLLTFGQFLIILIFLWNFGCVGPENL